MDYYGDSGKIDYESAFNWFMKSAEKGYIYSYRMQGTMYLTGQEVEADYEEGMKWYEKAEEYE